MTIYLTNPTTYHDDNNHSGIQLKGTTKKDDSVPLCTTSTSTTTDVFTSDNSFTSNIKSKRNKILSFFPSSKEEVAGCNTIGKKWQGTEENNKKAQTINSSNSTSFYNNPVTTSSSITTSSTSSSSTIYQSLDSNMSKHNFKVVNPSSIPDYANLRKYFSKFHSKSKKQKSDILKNHLLPWLGKNIIRLCLHSKDELEETGFWGLRSVTKENKELQFGRSILLKWWRILLNNMSIIEAEERSLYYDCILEIMSRCEFMDYDFIGSPSYSQWYKRDNVPHTSSVDDYRNLLSTTLNYAIDKLNQKAVYSNMISFCATVLALSYFKIPGLASSLLQKLIIRPTVMKKLYKEMKNDINSDHQQFFKNKSQYVFPKFLQSLMVSDTLSYQKHWESIKPQDSPVTLSGNWIRRWQSDDSELFFTFYKKYHSILKMYTSIIYPTISRYQLHQRNSILLNLPGYMYLASFFACKIDSLIHRELNSVTTMTHQEQQQNVLKKAIVSPLIISTGENISAVDESKSFLSPTVNNCTEYNPLSKVHPDMSAGKPKALIMATKRYAECLVWCTTISDSQGLYLDMLNVWLRFSVKRTVLTEAGEVYCMIDFLEQTILELQKYPLKRDYPPVDIPFILHTLDIILSQSDHTTSLLRALTFIYVHFGFLTSHAALLDLLCNRIMLDTQNFERLLLHWGRNVRHFFLRCLMWRVGRVWHSAGIRWNSETGQMMRTIVRKNTNSTTVAPTICEGHTCRIEWERILENNNETLTFGNNTISDELLAYRKCSLEIHMSLETLMAAFHQQHLLLQQKYTTLSYCSKLNTPVPVINDDGECVTPVPERIRKFSSQLALPPAKVLNTNQPSSDIKDLENNNNNGSQEKYTDLKSNTIHRRYKASTLTMKKHLVIKSRNSKERLFKLFNNSGTIITTQNSTIAPTVNTCTTNDDDQEEDNIGCSEYYTVSSPYSVTSSHEHKSADKKRRSLDQPSSENQASKRIHSIIIENNDNNTTDVLNNSSSSNQKNDFIFERSLSSSKNSLLQTTKNNMTHCNSSNRQKHYTTDSNTLPLKIPEILTPSRNWKYHPSNHVYAVKVISDMRPILHEYCIWIEKNQSSKSNLSVAYVPRLSLEWPKNWSYSHT